MLAFKESHSNPIRQHLGEMIFAAIETKFGKIPPEAGVRLQDIIQDLEKPPESQMGDWALPCFRFAKTFRKNPAQIATELKNELLSQNDPWFAKVEVVGSFLNIFIPKTLLAQLLLKEIQNQSYFKLLQSDTSHAKTRVMVEYSQPNTHKEFHVGHARNIALGDSLCRMLNYCGYKVLPVNYIGDEGTHVAKCLWQVKRYQGEQPTENFGEWYGKRYVEANLAIEEADPTTQKKIKDEISEILANLENKKGEDYKLWLKSREDCMRDFEHTYKWLDVHFDHVFFESEVSEESQSIVDEYIAKGLFKESKGAIGIDMEPYKLGFFMARKSDGTSLYITKDLALARKKFGEFQIDRSIYVVASEQNFHFAQLFKALELMGFEQAKQCYHLSYAHVRLPEGKMSSRKGNTFTFSSLKELLLEELNKTMEKYKDQWSKEEMDTTQRLLAVGAIKYGMLSADPQKEIIFAAEQWTAFEGNTGPYLMYSYSRSRAILRKAADEGVKPAYDQLDNLNDPLEGELLRGMYDFNPLVVYACENYRPSSLASYLFDLCKAFNRFYKELSVLKAETDALKASRLALVETFSLTLKTGLSLLGITPPERM